MLAEPHSRHTDGRTSTTRLTSLGDAWRRGLDHSAHAPALRIGGAEYSYGDLHGRASALAALVGQTSNDGAPVAVLAARSMAAYGGVLGAVLAGRTYVPLHPEFPALRTASMLTRSGASVLVVGPEALDAARAVLEGLSPSRTVIVAEGPIPNWAASMPTHRFLGEDALTPGSAPDSTSSSEPAQDQHRRDYAYLLFTSGSTGQPKGVGVTQENVAAYLNHALDAFALVPSDRCSQMFDLTFDLSVHDLFVTWAAGACLCVPSKRTVLAPAKFVRDEELTCWFSVPSVAMVMQRLHMLKAGSFESLRLSLFCGEALPDNIARAWSHAAPRSELHNLYGPTEATIAITSHRWRAEAAPHPVVPIGRVFPGHAVAVVSGDQTDAATGELLVAGPQVTPGYWNDAERTAQSFVELPGDTRRWYRTGDLVERSSDGTLLYRGRVDDQVQIMGFRVELLEVDQALRTALGTSLAVAVADPPGPAAEAIFAFAVSETDVDEATALAACRLQLPSYMVPRRIFFVSELPTNANGKIDRSALRSTLESSRHD
jgi:amino acid adenylation domain-containing protein